jgi:hypothetical protein
MRVTASGKCYGLIGNPAGIGLNAIVVATAIMALSSQLMVTSGAPLLPEVLPVPTLPVVPLLDPLDPPLQPISATTAIVEASQAVLRVMMFCLLNGSRFQLATM